ncbi:15-cis-phytoene synthase [Lutimaribacter marinistellae]|uniref:15-cis-phytoene synthase n=1 Tax=Lutimaribacter marinistellae TaxID=1820329 RepID=A0ABV7TKF6_9RHOB
MIDAEDMAHCVEAIRHGSLSFHTASRLLPARVRDPALALYAFCRLADDAVDLQEAKARAVLDLHERLEKAYAGRPDNAPADRAFTAVVEQFEMPRALPEALLEGLAWDAMERRYASLEELRSYSARVASTVGAMMCVLMRKRGADALARACDLGVAMQLTNIARDVGEDAREGRLYLPLEWLSEEDIEPKAFLAAPRIGEGLSSVIRRLLREAERLYSRAETGIALLPLDARPGIYAARYIYADIGRIVARNGYDSITRRARTSAGRKLGRLGLSVLRAGMTMATPLSPVIHARPLPETEFLVAAAARQQAPQRDWSDTLHESLVVLKSREAERRAALIRPLPTAR